MNNRIRGVHQAVVLVATQAETGRSQVSAENAYSSLKKLVEARKLQVQLQRLPEAQFGIARVASPHQQVQRGTVALQQVGGDVRPDVSGRAGQEYRHVAPLVPVLTASPFAGAS